MKYKWFTAAFLSLCLIPAAGMLVLPEQQAAGNEHLTPKPSLAGVHDGSPYKQVNPMQHYENTASVRGSRVDGFNPEYGAPTLPTVEILREMMDEKDLQKV